MKQVCAENGANLPDSVIVAHGPQSALGHEGGHGVIEKGEPVLVDIWPQDIESKCYADMSRTFVAGGGSASAKLEEFWRLCKESIDVVMPEIRPGASCREIFELSCGPFEAAGQPTKLSATPGEVLESGFYHGLGHGIGLDVHESPMISKSNDELVAGDVITIEPGCYEPGYGGCRLEDLVLVTDSGYEVLTNFPYDL
jgi:Xaa-Pro aminopeptidase